ncbi:hypothetical protein [Halalkalibacterium ligniniphilum]|uniref:hypothetical protein n=1 Tax=Halalkalibacterium ligniniphilum TaxID=1134413 RepID=UPI001376200C|nr:hypothetical protein [Halalkalibacterium ligniniphilum]
MVKEVNTVAEKSVESTHESSQRLNNNLPQWKKLTPQLKPYQALQNSFRTIPSI